MMLIACNMIFKQITPLLWISRKVRLIQSTGTISLGVKKISVDLVCVQLNVHAMLNLNCPCLPSLWRVFGRGMEASLLNPAIWYLPQEYHRPAVKNHIQHCKHCSAGNEYYLMFHKPNKALLFKIRNLCSSKYGKFRLTHRT